MKLKSFFLMVMCVCMMSQTSSALKPIFSGNLLKFKYEYGDYSYYTVTKATIAGVETWFKKYESNINAFVIYGAYNDYLPYIGFTSINSWSLAAQIYNDPELGLSDIPVSVVYDIIGALNNDRDVGYFYHVDFEVDPYYDWKWRSNYMEQRRMENNSTTNIRANCWGTADYLAKDYEWVDGYYENKQWALNNNYSLFGASFPHVYLDGGKYDIYGNHFEHCIDDDLSGENGNVEFKISGYGRTKSPDNILNSFDVIRLSNIPLLPYDPDFYEMATSTGLNVGENLHCVAYICTDKLGKSWVYEKHNYGNTREHPYGLNVLGYDQWTSPVKYLNWYDLSYNSYFKKYSYNKTNLADSYDENWAGITP